MIFYTYMWLEDGTPYYVGKGHDDRAFRRGAPPDERIVLQDWPCEKDAFTAERLLIALYGRKIDGGILNNLAIGGAGGAAGVPRTKVWLERMAASQHGKKRTAAARENMRVAHLGKPQMPGQSRKGFRTKHCRKGHLRTFENTRITKNGWQRCLECVASWKPRVYIPRPKKSKAGSKNPNFGNHAPWSAARRAAQERKSKGTL